MLFMLGILHNYITHRIHGTGIFDYISLIFMVNVGKYTTHRSWGNMLKSSDPFWSILVVRPSLDFFLTDELSPSKHEVIDSLNWWPQPWVFCMKSIVSLSLFDSTVSSFKSYTLHRMNCLFQDGNVFFNIPKQFLQNDQFSYNFLTLAHTVDGSEILEKPVGMHKTS